MVDLAYPALKRRAIVAMPYGAEYRWKKRGNR
jgi:hypothetical protein